MAEKRDIKKNLKDAGSWVRIVFMIFFVLLYGVAITVFWAVTIVQALFSLFTGKVNPKVLRFSEGLTAYILQCLNFISYQTEDQPFPFMDWPSGKRRK